MCVRVFVRFQNGGHAKAKSVLLALVDASMYAKECAWPAIAGLAAGVSFLFVLSAAVSIDMTPVRLGHADSPTDEDRVLLIELLQKAERTDLVHLLCAKYPPLGPAAIYQYGDVESDWRATIVYASGPKSYLDYPGLPANTYFGYVPGSLISYHAPSIWLTFNRSGDIQEIELRCLVTYLGSDKQFGGIMSRNATDISELLRSQSC